MKAEIIIAAFTLIFVENYVFTRFIGLDVFEEKNSFKFCIFLIAVMPISVAISFLICGAVIIPLHAEYLEAMVYVLIPVITVFGIRILLKNKFQKLDEALTNLYIPVSVNAAILKFCMDSRIKFQWSFNAFLQCISGAVFVCLGFILFFVICKALKRKISLCSCPKAFEGMPIIMVSIGLVSLLFSVFSI